MNEVIVLLKQRKDTVEVLVDGTSCGSIVDVRPYYEYPSTAIDVIGNLITKLDINAKVRMVLD